MNDVKLAKKCLMYLRSYTIAIFFLPNTKVANNDEQKPYQPVMWRVFNRPSNKKSFRIEIAKSIPHIGFIAGNGQAC